MVEYYSDEDMYSWVGKRGWPKTEEFARRLEELFLADIRNSYERVREFHEKFGHPVSETPDTIAPNRAAMRLALILEEALELADAIGYYTDELEEDIANMFSDGPSRGQDLISIADALGDIEYVVNGAALEYGIDLPAVVAEIHRSNMTKLGPDGKPIYREDGKILKGEDYEPPNLESVLFV